MRPARNRTLGLLCAMTCATVTVAFAQAVSRPQQIAAAVLPLPPGLRSGAGVVFLDSQGTPRQLRPSSNGMVCLADVPGDSIFDVRCYQESFVPLIYRIRQLKARGLAGATVDQTIDAEAPSGRVTFARAPTAGYRMYGPIAGYDPSSNAVTDTIDAWQSVHMPYRTAAAVGLPTHAEGTHPYMMSSGTFWAHVMIMQRPLRY